MKLSVAAYRASASNVNRRLSSLNGRPRPRTSSTQQMARSVSWGSSQVENAEEVIVPPGPPSAPPTPPSRLSRELNVHSGDEPPTSTVPSTKEKPEEGEGEEDKTSRKNPPPVRQPSRGTRGTQRWMKLRTTVQLSGAVSSAVKEKKPPLKREDSFLKRFSTRQIAEASETVDNDGESAAVGAAGGGASGIRARVAARRRRRRRAGIGGFDEPLTVINPDENFYFGWLSLLTLCVLYNCWTLIVRQAFPELQRIAHALWVATDVVSDLVFLCDIGVQFRTGYLEQGLMVYDSKKLAMHYIRSRAFILDLACLLPLDIVQLWTATPNPIIRFPRFLKVYRSYNYYYMVESRTLYPNVWRVVNLIHILLLLAHWFGCFFFLLSEAENFKGNWTYPEPKGDFATLTRKYLGSLYWSTLTLTTIGDLPTPDSDWHRPQLWSSSDDGPVQVSRRGVRSRLLYLGSDRGYLFTIVSYLIGVFIFATIVGQVGNVITNRNASRLEFERLLDGAKLYMRQHKVPREMQRRVQRWYDYSWSRGRMQGGGDINSALGILPDKLKTELALHVNLNTLKKVSIFQECQPEFLHDLVLKMKAYIFTPGDLICRKGEVAREMFIIADGILQVISETGKVLTTMRAGDFFGEIGILNLDGLNKRTADVRSVGYSELFSLSREDVLTAMKDYPEAQEILQSLGRKRLMEAKLAAAGLKKDTDGDSMKESVGTGDPSAADDRGNGDNEGSRSKALQMMRRIKRDARELRNYLRRGINRDPLPREEAKQTESVRIEMEPLSPGSTEPSVPGSTLSVLEKDSSLRKLLWGKTKEATSGPTRELPSTKAGLRTKGILMRMQKITSQQEPPTSDSASIRTPSPPLAGGGGEDEGGGDQQPLGAGLPLFQRLRLLKEREERAKAKGDTAVATSSSTSTSTLPSQPLPLTRTDDLPSRGPKEELTPQPPEEPIGAGLPLFQRLRMLKEREEKERAEAERQQTSAISSAAGGAGGGSGKLSLAKAVLLKKLETLREEEKGDGGSGTVEVPTQVTPPPSSPASFPPPTPKTPPPSQKEAEILSKSSPKRVTGGILFAPPPSLKATEFKPEEYLADLLLGVKQVLQTRLEEIQGQFKSRLVSLEEEVKRKNLIIQRLEETLQRCEVKEVYNETHGTSQPLPQTENDKTFPPHKDKDDSHVTASSPGEASFDEDDDYFDDEFEQASDVTHPGYVSHPRRSWPLLPPWSERHRVGVPQRAWESQAALVLDPEHLWRAEFPLEPRVPPLPPAWVAVSTSALNGSSLDDDDERSSRNDDGSEGDASSEDDGQDDLPPPQPQGNQWEIQMLAEQLLSKRHVTDADPTDSDSSGELPKEEGADEGDGEEPRRRGRRKVVRKSRPRKEDRNQRVREEGEEEEEEGGDEEEDDDEDRGSGGLLGVLQQLSPTEQRELERLLAVATRKHLTRQLSLRSSEATLQVPVRRRSVASCATPPTAPSLPPVRRRVPTPLPPPPPPPSTSLPSSAYLHVSAAAPPPSSSSSAGLLLSPPTDDDSVSICIPEYEPLLGPKK